MNKYKYIKSFNFPFLKYEIGNVHRIINLNDLSEIFYWNDGRGLIYFKNGSEREIALDVAKELDDFIMNYKQDSCGYDYTQSVQNDVILMDMESMHEKQSLYDWLNENGQA